MPTKKKAGKKAVKKRAAKKETSDKMSTLASKAMRGEQLTPAEVRALGASVLSQDETKGKRTKKKKT